MKVSAISFSSGIISAPEPSVNRAFLYMPKLAKPEVKQSSFMLKMLSVAALAVLLTLMNIKGSKKFPDNITEIVGENIGLNKIKNQTGAVKKIKEEFLYPVMAAMKGDEAYLQKNSTRTGIILAGKNSRELLEALTKHAEQLGMNVKSMPENKDNVYCRKWTYHTIKKIQKNYRENEKFTFVNLGNLGLITEMKIIKQKKSLIEEFLKSINVKDKPGIIWGAWTDKPDALPYFFVREDVPVLIAKTLD
jgi:hypothetical protein